MVTERDDTLLVAGIRWSCDFEDLDQARKEIAAFIDRYNNHSLIERLEYRTPAQAHEELLQEAA